MNRYDLVLLGLIFEKDRCGYDIMTEIRTRELDRWAKISTSTIYSRLTRLEKSEYIVGRTEHNDKRPDRMVYAITDSGVELFRKEVIRHLTGFNDDPRTLGFAFLFGFDSYSAVVRALEAHKRHLMSEIERLEQMIAEEPKPTLYREGPFLNCMSRDHILVELKYCSAAIEILRNPLRSKKLDRYFGINFGARDYSVIPKREKPEAKPEPETP